MKFAFPPVRCLADVIRAALLVIWSAAPVRAQLGSTSEASWWLEGKFGAGSYESALPTPRGEQRVLRAPFPTVGFELGGATPRHGRLRWGATAAYASSIGYEIRRSIFEDTSERSAVRTQELRAQLFGELALLDGAVAVALPFALGYGFWTLTSETRLIVPSSYALSGPYAQAGVHLGPFAGRLNLAVLGELGAVLTRSEALDRAGAENLGYAYGVMARATLRLTPMLEVGLAYREGRARLPLRGSGDFRELRSFLLASVVLRV